MPYAAENQVSTDPLDGGIEITQGQYQQAIAGMLEGKIVTIDGGFAVVDPPTHEDEPTPEPEPSLEEVQAQQIAIINDAFEAAAQALTAGYPATERLTWPVQQAEALAWAANPSAPTPYLDGLAAARGITPEEMRQMTLDQVNLFLAASQQLVGTRQRLRDQINAAETIEDARAVVWPNPET